MVVAYRDGAPVHLGELAIISDSVQNDKIANWYVNNGESSRGIVLAVQRQPGTNTVEVVKGVREIMAKLRQQHPASVDLDVLYDRSASIQESVLPFCR